MLLSIEEHSKQEDMPILESISYPDRGLMLRQRNKHQTSVITQLT
jgi:hypothetical protein